MSDKSSGVYARGGNTLKQTNLGCTPAITLKAGLRRALHRYERFGEGTRTAADRLGRDARTR
jgi:hypothetical protein